MPFPCKWTFRISLQEPGGCKSRAGIKRHEMGSNWEISHIYHLDFSNEILYSFPHLLIFLIPLSAQYYFYLSLRLCGNLPSMRFWYKPTTFICLVRTSYGKYAKLPNSQGKLQQKITVSTRKCIQLNLRRRTFSPIPPRYISASLFISNLLYITKRLNSTQILKTESSK